MLCYVIYLFIINNHIELSLDNESVYYIHLFYTLSFSKYLKQA